MLSDSTIQQLLDFVKGLEERGFDLLDHVSPMHRQAVKSLRDNPKDFCRSIQGDSIEIKKQGAAL